MCVTSSNQTEQLRLFVAVTLPTEARGALAEVIGRLRAANLRGVRTVAPEGVHITLKFLGNVDAGRVSEISEALTGAAHGSARFTLALQGLGAFPDGRAPRVLWAGVTVDTAVSGDAEAGVSGFPDALGALARRVDDACAGLGFPRERRPFSPHLTIARLRDSATDADRRRAADALAAIGLDYSGGFEVSAMHLIKSTLTASGALYETVCSVDLQDRPT